MWETSVASDRIDEFCALLSSVLPQILATDGCLGGEILRPLDANRVVAITRWRDEEALRMYLGPMWRVRPVWVEQELPYMVRNPQVCHFVTVES